MRTSKKFKSISVVIITCSMSFQSVLAFAQIPQSAIALQTERTIAQGATYKEYKEVIGSSNVTFREVEVDLKNPYIKIAPLFGNAGQIGSKATVSSMAQQSGALAAINSSFFRTDNEGGTLGMLLKDGKLLSSPSSITDWNTFALLKNGQAMIGTFGFTGQVNAPNGKQFPLDGLNKTEYFPPGGVASNYSGNIEMFTNDWGPLSRGKLDGYDDMVELEERNQKVTDIRNNQGPKPIPADGYVLWANGPGAQFLRDNFKLGDSINVSYAYTPNTFNINEAIGANYLLVDNGAPVAQFPTDPSLVNKHSRSALGLNLDGSKMYLVSVDRSDTEPGVTLPELADFLVSLGVYRGVNLDGGVSTSLVVQQPGDLQVTRVNDPSEEQPVADALGIFNTAPPGSPDHLEINGPKQVLVGQSSTFTFKGYDTNYHPIDPKNVTWSVTDGMGSITGGLVNWQKGGDAKVSAKVGDKSIDYPVYIIGKEVIQGAQLTASKPTVAPNEKLNLNLTLTLANGTTYTPDQTQIKWTVDDQAIGKMDGATFIAGQKEGKTTIEAEVFGVKAKTDVSVSQGYLFNDIASHWARDNIEIMAQKGFAKGTGNGQFSPDKSLTRADFIVFLSRMLNWKITDEDRKVTIDETIPDYAADALKYAKRAGILVGDANGKLAPYKPISRVEAAAILDRVMPASSQPTSASSLKASYDDWSDIPDWGRGAVNRLTNEQIFGGINHKFYPKKDITRAEMVTVLLRAFVNNEGK